MACTASDGTTSIVTWILVIVGWLVVNQQNNQRETRKEIRNRVDDMRVEVLMLEELAFKHHTEANDAGRRADIRRRIAALSTRVRTLSEAGLNVAAIWPLVAAVRTSITLDNFDDDYVQLSANNQILTTIGSDIAALLKESEVAYSARYHRRLRDRLLGL